MVVRWGHGITCRRLLLQDQRSSMTHGLALLFRRRDGLFILSHLSLPQGFVNESSRPKLAPTKSKVAERNILFVYPSVVSRSKQPLFLALFANSSKSGLISPHFYFTERYAPWLGFLFVWFCQERHHG